MAVTYSLSVARSDFERVLHALIRTRQSVAYGTVQQSHHTADHIEGLLAFPPDTPHLPTVTPTHGSRALLRLLPDFNAATLWPHEALALLHAETEGILPLVEVALDPTGQIRGWVWTSAETRFPVTQLTLMGTGMHRIPLNTNRVPSDEVPSATDQDRWSRLIGALGRDTWQRLRGLHYALIGLGRNGSLMASSLARLGANQMTLIDPDQVERHNLDAMDGVTEADIGISKVTAVAKMIRELVGNQDRLQTIPRAITTPWAFSAAKTADVLISCVDHDGARLTNAIIATLYGRPLLDIGSGVFNDAGTRQMGGDVRLIIPGASRCLWCFGGFANSQQVRDLFSPRPTPPLSWQETRAGSLRSLNQLNTHLGLRLLEDFINERVTTSTWLHLDFNPQGQPTIQTVNPPAQPHCPLCQWQGLGDMGLAQMNELATALLNQLDH